jgi:hypothetical protein
VISARMPEAVLAVVAAADVRSGLIGGTKAAINKLSRASQSGARDAVEIGTRRDVSCHCLLCG